jgi:hypothetical protein
MFGTLVLSLGFSFSTSGSVAAAIRDQKNREKVNKETYSRKSF